MRQGLPAVDRAMSDMHSSDYIDVTHPDARVGACDRILEPIRRVFRWTSVLLLAVMIALPVLQVILRQFFSRPFMGAEELARFMLICVVFVTLPYVVSSGASIRMEEVMGTLPKRLRRVLRFAIPATGGLAFAVAATSIAIATLRNLDNATPTLNIPYWIFFASGFLGLTLAAVECALQAFKAWRRDPLYVTFAQEQPSEDVVHI